MNEHQIVIGSGAADHVRIAVRLPFDAEGWARAEIAVQNGAFSGRFETMLWRVDLDDFRSDLQDLVQMPDGVAELDTAEGSVELALTGDGPGQILVTGSLSDDPETERSLELEFAIHQTSLPGIQKALSDLLG